MTRLVQLELSGFRAFPRPVTFNLDSDVVLLTGPNGSGKTSVFDGILWALCGRVGRIEDREGGVVSLYSESGVAHAGLRMRDGEGNHWRLVRTTDGNGLRTLSLTTAGESFEGRSAQTKILELLWPDALLTDNSDDAFEMALTRGVYLQQDLVRQFLESDTDEGRFEMVGELVGAGRITEFQRQLDSARNAWTRARTSIERELARIDQQVDQLSARLSRLQAESVDEGLRLRWRTWWKQVVEVPGVSLSQVPLSVSSAGLTQILEDLQARRRAALRRRGLAQTTLSELSEMSQAHDLSDALVTSREEISLLETELSSIRERLEVAQREVSAIRQQLVLEHERSEELRALASLALRHLDERCPVCDQNYDIDGTRERLTAILSVSEGPRVNRDASVLTDTIEVLTREVGKLEGQLATAYRGASELETHLSALAARREAARLTLNELGIDEDAAAQSRVAQLLEALDSEIERLSVLYQGGGAAVAGGGSTTRNFPASRH